MYRSSKRNAPSPDAADAVVIEYDDGGSGILQACRDRFATAECEIACDSRHTVWITTSDGSHSIGLSPWMLGRRSMGDLLDGVEARLGIS